MTAYLQAVRAALPTTFIVAAGCPGGAPKTAVDDQCHTTFTNWADPFSMWVSINSLAYETDSDAIHPSGGDAGTGHTSFGNEFYAQILAGLNSFEI